MSRTLNVIRMQLVNRQTYIWVPLIVLAGSLVVTLAIYAILINAGVDGPKYGGGAQAPLWLLAVVGAQALTRTFPFSQAMSVTRREFYLGTMLTAMLAAAVLALIFVAGGLLELATGGWGMNGYFFHLPWIWEAGPAVAGLFFFALALLFFAVGFWGATIYKRAGTAVLMSVMIGLALVLVAVLWLVGRLNAWAEAFGWFATQGALGLGLWSLLVIAVLAAISYLTLRRATP
ncbi:MULTISPECIES: hypothetical protein [Microbacterium]|uniref:Uncharacterized protein n=1 Tax=Microbacterium saccharophilum TaxID=1213358 RepID=A0A7Z7D2W4_9MICO|nr:MULTISPECIES: hypothetical protein [Microbacterium]SFI52606.1 hypothetical protein SAMN04487751_2083 [Microbacterium saccharophilum]